jgi:hypothetical protein
VLYSCVGVPRKVVYPPYANNGCSFEFSASDGVSSSGYAPYPGIGTSLEFARTMCYCLSAVSPIVTMAVLSVFLMSHGKGCSGFSSCPSNSTISRFPRLVFNAGVPSFLQAVPKYLNKY